MKAIVINIMSWHTRAYTFQENTKIGERYKSQSSLPLDAGNGKKIYGSDLFALLKRDIESASVSPDLGRMGLKN